MYDIEKPYQVMDVRGATQAPGVDPSAVVISGEGDVLTKIREGKFVGRSLVNIHGTLGLEEVRTEEDGTIVIGPATTFSHMTNGDIIMKHTPILENTVNQAGGPQLYNTGTAGDNMYNGVTSADNASSFYVLNAILALEGLKGTREASIREWYTGPGRAMKEYEEMPIAIKIGRESYEDSGGYYIKYDKWNVMEIATPGCMVIVKLNDDKCHIEEIHLGYDVAAPIPIRYLETEEKVKDIEVGEALYETVGEGALEEVNPRPSWRVSREFRL